MADQDEKTDHHRANVLSEFMLFSVSLVFILFFMFINIYTLPLGTTSPEGTVENAPDIYGLDIGVGGEALLITDREFKIVGTADSGSLNAIWNGNGDLPINGTMIIAEGIIVASPSGPVLFCESITPLKTTDAIFDNPWSLPSLRLLIIVLLWFSVTTAATGAASLASHFWPKTLNENRVRALIEVCALSGLISFVCLALLAISEPGLVGGIGIPTVALSISFFLIIISVAMQRTERHDIVEMSSGLPIAAAIIAVIGVLMIAEQQQLLAADMIGAGLAEFLPDFFIAAVIGIVGFTLMGVYLGERRYYTISIRGLLVFGKGGVK